MISTITPQSLVMGNGSNYVLTEARGFESPTIDVAKTNLAGRHGVTVHRAFWRERIIRLEFGLRANTTSAYATLRKNFLEAWDLARNGNTTIPFTTVDGKNLEIIANNANVIDGGYQAGYVTTGKIRVELICGDPNIYTQSSSSETLTPPVAGGTTLPTAIPMSLTSSGGSAVIVNSGNGTSYPVITIYGIATNAHVRNSTLGVQFNITEPLTSSQYVVVDTEAQTVLLNGTTNWLEHFDGSWWWLEAGNNSIQYNSDDNDPSSYVTISWKSAYLGI